MKKINVVVLMGGRSAEHDVSIITGLQVIEHLDRERFESFAVVLSQENIFWLYPGLSKRKDYKKIKPVKVILATDENGSYIKPDSALGRKTYLDVAYLAFHGGNGESGQIQGFCELINLAYSSPSMESSVLNMNKVVTKEVLKAHNIETLDWVGIASTDIQNNLSSVSALVTKKLSLPVIIKPAHLGSSIAINIAKTPVELKKYLNEASFVDTEVLIEKYIRGFKEYNCSVRLIEGNLEASEIEEPLAKDEILSFADKYQRGGSKKGAGMASLSRSLPADIDKKTKELIQETAKKVFLATRAKGMVRIDFMEYENRLYVTEVNPIPGSMAFYLWEASGITFQKQITDMLMQALEDQKTLDSKKIIYSSDIVEKFVDQ